MTDLYIYIHVRLLTSEVGGPMSIYLLVLISYQGSTESRFEKTWDFSTHSLATVWESIIISKEKFHGSEATLSVQA